MAVTPDSFVAPRTVVASVPLEPGAAFRSVQWGAVILGALGASAISAVLLAFGAGIGLSAASAQPWAGASAKALAVISVIYTAIVLVASFGGGGYIAGRMRLPPTAEELAEADFRDGAHGFAVWALGIFVGGLIALSGVSGAVKAVGQATAAIGGATAAGAASNPELGRAAVSMTPTDYAIDRLLAPAPAGAGAAPAAGAPSSPSTSPPSPSSPSMTAAAAPTPTMSRADLTAPLTRSFASALRTGQLDARDRATLVATVMQQTGLPQADAEKRVDEAYADIKTAEQKARDAAEKARKAAVITAFAVASTLLLACAAACAGATAGARHRHERTVVTLFGSRRFW
jgi:hypothetical protein